MTDDHIIELIKSGKDDKAFLSLYKYFPVIKKMVLANGGKMEDAQDTYQEALIILHKKIMNGDFKLSAKLSTYLYSVCKYLWKDQLKKNNKILSSEFKDEMDIQEESGLEEMIEKENRIKIAEKIISELGERCKELLLLFYSGSMKLKEIAPKWDIARKIRPRTKSINAWKQLKRNCKKFKLFNTPPLCAPNLN